MSTAFDPRKNQINLRKHGVSLSEGDGVLNDPLAVTVEDISTEGEQRFATIGMKHLWILDGSCMDISRRHYSNNFSSQKPNLKKGEPMRKEYDFSKGKRGRLSQLRAKHASPSTWMTTLSNNSRRDRRKPVKVTKTLINEALNVYLGTVEQPITPELIRTIVREELASHE